jgi:hypothetical protein
MIDGMAEDVVTAWRNQYRCPAVFPSDGRRCPLQDRPRRPTRARLEGNAQDLAAWPSLAARTSDQVGRGREWSEPWADGAASRGEQLRWQAF